ncbi:MAG: M1 family metallopeptidase [Bacteroidota bacterium]
MKKITLSILCLLLFTGLLFAQDNLLQQFQSSSNALYWKNRKPFVGYWQQDVFYSIEANIDETADRIDGKETLYYTNNSPDTLPFVFFHLYQQAFVKGGYLENLNTNNQFKNRFGKYEAEGKGCIMHSIKQHGVELKTIQDFSVVKVLPVQAILPGETVTFDITFSTWWDNGSQRRRFKKFDSYGSTHYDGVHWYPRICVYDRKMGWDTYQHLGKEFYGDYGVFDVKLTFSSDYVVEATGELQNESVVLSDELRAKLDIKNFIHKPWESAPSVITPYDKNNRKTWHYKAMNVHDFAFTADPNYRIGEVNWNGIRVVALVQEPHAAGWYNAASFTAMVIKTYSEDFGYYAWPKIIVADARDGMEYPMLTLDGGYNPAYRDLIAHEVGHQWFFGMVGNNETYRALLDEGFTQFIQCWAQLKIDGPKAIQPQYRSKLYARFKDEMDTRYSENYYAYINDAMRGVDDPINQISDGFNGALNHGGGYRHVYYKTATMLWNLQYVLGDSLFSQAMKHYFNQWKFCHPYVEDFRNSIIQYTKVDLNWFFDQWLETNKKLDYSVACVKRKKGNYQVKLKRKERMESPIDLTISYKDGSKQSFHIPNNWYVKAVDTNKVNVLPKWYGWDKIQPSYTFSIPATQKIKTVQLDDTYRLADINLLNNSSRLQVKWRFDSHISNMPEWKHYVIKWRPDVWLNNVDGIKAGIHLNGNYMNYRHKFNATIWYNTGLAQSYLNDINPNETAIAPIHVNLDYTNPLPGLMNHTDISIKARYLDGLLGGYIGFETQLNKNNLLEYGIKKMYRSSDINGASYLLYNNLWNYDAWNNTLRLVFTHKYRYVNGTGVMKWSAISSTLLSKQQFSWINLEVINRNKPGKLDIDTRFFMQYGSDNIPFESRLYLAGANPETLMDDKYVRSQAFFPADWTNYGAVTNRFQYGGGLNLRGYAGYTAISQQGNDLTAYPIYTGSSGASFSAECYLHRLIRFQPKHTRNSFSLKPYLFADAGTMMYRNNKGDQLVAAPRADAGAGVLLVIKRFWYLDEVDDLTIRFDMPLWLNRPPFEESEFVKMRWLLTVRQSF